MSVRRRALAARMTLAVIVLCALLSSFDLLRFAITVVPPFPTGNPVSVYERRFDALKARLPRRGVVGYIEEGQPTLEVVPEMDPAKIGAFDRLHLAQYALAPIILQPGYDHDLVVGNFNTFEPDFVETARHQLVLVQNFGHGVALFHREPDEPGEADSRGPASGSGASAR